MILEQFYLACLSQASYLVADEISGRAVVVDPRRDIDEYLEAAAERQLHIELIVLTHVHADFIPGHSELAAVTGATVGMGESAPVTFPIRRFGDGERVLLGDPHSGVALEVLATPGHTPESITLAVFESADDDAPAAILTGDTLFLGDVGRPDLLGAAGLSANDMARDLYRSLRTKILPLPDSVVVYPGHGAGSACGKALSSETSSTLGAQRRTNYALAPMTEDTFVHAVTEGLAEQPAYFAEDVALNRTGHQLFDPTAPIDELDASAAVETAANGRALLLDVRDNQVFAAGHLRGAVNVGLSGRFADHAASVHMPGQVIVLFGSLREVSEARTRLARVGLEAVVGAVTAADALTSVEALVTTSSRLTVPQAANRIETVPDLQVVDVRSPDEVAGGSLPNAVNLPLQRLRDHLAELDPDHPVLVSCTGGYRSIAAASLLEARGFRDVSDLMGGWTAWQAAQAPATLDH